MLTFNQGLRPLRPSVGSKQTLRLIFYSADVVADNQRVQSALKKDKDSVARRDSENEDVRVMTVSKRSRNLPQKSLEVGYIPPQKNYSSLINSY